MNSKIFLIAFITFIILISGCAQKSQQKDGSEARTEIESKYGSTAMVISPSNGSIIAGVVAIKMAKVPKGTNLVAFAIQGPGIEDIGKTGPNLGYDTDGSNGWSFELDTVVYPDGAYAIYAFTSPISSLEEADKENAPPSGMAEAKVKIQNAGAAGISLEPPEIKFYKGISTWPAQNMKEHIVSAKNSGANIVGLSVVANYENNKIVLPNGWSIFLKTSIREAYRNGLAVSIGVSLPQDMEKKFPYREGSDIDLPPGYDLTPFADNMKEVYREIAIFAEENKVHSIIIPLEIEAWIGRVYENSGEYWGQSSMINREVTKEIRKYYKGEIVGSILGGAWGFDAPCCYTNVPVDKIDFSGFDALAMPTSSDYRITGSPLGYVAEGLKRIEFTREIANKNNVKKIYAGVGGFPLISPWKGDRVALYGEFFEKSRGLVDGYEVSDLPENFLEIYDNKSLEAAKIWYKKI